MFDNAFTFTFRNMTRAFIWLVLSGGALILVGSCEVTSFFFGDFFCNVFGGGGWVMGVMGVMGDNV